MKTSKYKKLINEKKKKRAFKLYQQGLTTREVGAMPSIKMSHQWVAYVVREKENKDKRT